MQQADSRSRPYTASRVTTRLATSGSADLPVAILDLDLHILHTNRSFEQSLGLQTNVRKDAHISELVSPAEGADSFVAIRNQIRRERERREPAYLPPILEQGRDALSEIREADLDYWMRRNPLTTHTWICHGVRERSSPFHVQIWLVKAVTYFVIVRLPSPAALAASSEQSGFPWQPQSVLALSSTSQPYASSSGLLFVQSSSHTRFDQPPPSRTTSTPSTSSAPPFLQAALPPVHTATLPPDVGPRTRMLHDPDQSPVFSQQSSMMMQRGLQPPSRSSPNLTASDVQMGTATTYPTGAPSTRARLDTAPELSMLHSQRFPPQTSYPKLEAAVHSEEGGSSGSETQARKRRRRIDIDDVLE